MKSFKTLDLRPTDVPTGWIIFNAPRGMPGDKEWVGNFRHGVFYTAVDPDGEFAAMNLKSIEDLDGWQVIYCSVRDVAAFVQNLCKEHNVDVKTLSLATLDSMQDQFIQAGWGIEV